MLDLVHSQPAIGPAPVSRVLGDDITVEIDGHPQRVVMAMPLRYRPCVGDVLLIAHGGETCYAIGVVSGTGSVELSSPGDLTLTAGGRMRVDAAEGFTATAPEMKLAAGRLELAARDLIATAQSFLQRIAGLLHLNAGRRHTQVEGSSVEQARQIVVKAQETVTVDGSTIHLG